MTSYGHKGGYPPKANDNTPQKGELSKSDSPLGSDTKKPINVFAPRRPAAPKDSEKKA